MTNHWHGVHYPANVGWEYAGDKPKALPTTLGLMRQALSVCANNWQHVTQWRVSPKLVLIIQHTDTGDNEGILFRRPYTVMGSLPDENFEFDFVVIR